MWLLAASVRAQVVIRVGVRAHATAPCSIQQLWRGKLRDVGVVRRKVKEERSVACSGTTDECCGRLIIEG